MFKNSFAVIFVLLLFMNSAYASQDLKFCISILKDGSANSLEFFESKLANISEQNDTFFSHEYENMHFDSFYSLRNRPDYYLWLLHHALREAKTSLNRHLDADESFDARRRMEFVGELFIYSSNLTNSWTRYEAYSGDTSLSEDEKGKISSDMLSLTGVINVYFGCLLANDLKGE